MAGTAPPRDSAPLSAFTRTSATATAPPTSKTASTIRPRGNRTAFHRVVMIVIPSPRFVALLPLWSGGPRVRDQNSLHLLFITGDRAHLLPVAEAASGQGHGQQRSHPEADSDVRDAAGDGRGGKEGVHGYGGRVDGPMRQDDEKGYVEEAPVRRVPGWDKKGGQVPQTPEGPEDEG